VAPVLPALLSPHRSAELGFLTLTHPFGFAKMPMIERAPHIDPRCAFVPLCACACLRVCVCVFDCLCAILLALFVLPSHA
jgi:hypothetical protein